MQMSVPDAAEQLGVSRSTIRNWLDKIGVNERNSHGHKVINQQTYQLLETAKILLEEGHTLTTVQRRLSTPTTPLQHQDNTDPPEVQHRNSIEPDEIADAVAVVLREQYLSIKGELQAVTSLSEKYAHAAHQIGKLEAENEFLRQQLTDAQSKIGLLEAPKPQKRFWKFWS